MASYRGITQGATAVTAQGDASRTPAQNTPQVAGGRGLTWAALYARVSTDKQEREETVASQVDLLRQTAAARGYEILPGNVFIDDGVSGTRLDRPALERLRDLAAEGAFDVVLVTAPDRLTRRYAYQVVLVEEFTRCGCGVVFAHQSLGASPAEQMLLRKTVTTPQHLVINEAEAEVVRQTRKSTRGRWAQSSVIEILRDPLYKGEAYDNRTQPGDVRRPYGPRGLKNRHPGNGQGRTRRPQTDWIPVRVPALIDPETWERAQAQLVRNRERAQRHNTQHRYLLRSLLVCGRCGRGMVGTWGAQGGRYICALRYPRYVPGACTGRSLGAATIEPCVWAHVKALLSDPAVLRIMSAVAGIRPWMYG
jgi:site-specific DNA recombinase